MRKATKGIMVNAGIFVKMAMPRNTPDSTIKILFLLSLIFFSDFDFLVETAINIERRRNGRRMGSNNIILVNHVTGNTAKRIEANNATFLLYLRSEIL